MTKTYFGLVFASLLAVPAWAAPVPPPARPDVKTAMFRMQDGKSIYEHVCQGCHMPGAKGAAGAGMYPALASNSRLGEAGYPLTIIIQGRKAMPAFGDLFSDAQIAQVVTYIRTHFGNHFPGAVTADAVKVMR